MSETSLNQRLDVINYSPEGFIHKECTKKGYNLFCKNNLLQGMTKISEKTVDFVRFKILDTPK